MKAAVQTRGVNAGSRHWLLRKPHRRVIIRLLLHGYTPTEVAQKMGCTTSALYLLMKKDHFKEALSEMETEIFSESDRYLKIAHRDASIQMIKAVKRLTKFMGSKSPLVAMEAIDRLTKLTEVSMTRTKGEGELLPVSGYTQNNFLLGNPAAVEAAQKLLEATRGKTYEVEIVK